MQTLTPHITPTVGKYYIVPCAELIMDHNGRTVHVPVIGPLHKDEAFDFPYPHYHIDGRFVKKIPKFSVDQGRTNQIIVLAPIPERPEWYHTYNFVRIVYKKKKCFNKATGLKINRHQQFTAMV